MRQYELTYLISDSVPESELNKITGKVNGEVLDFGGKIIQEEIWKRRRLAYQIKKQQYATYVTVNFELPGEKTQKLDHEIKLMPQAIRHLMLVQDYGSEVLTLSADEIADMGDIEKAVGGEKSFEAVEGETEESRDLQALRSKEEIEETEVAKEEVEVAAPKIKEVKEQTIEKEVVEEKVEVEKPKAKKPKKVENEADRLAKLDEELDSILKDEL